jgi:hypothetical protein
VGRGAAGTQPATVAAQSRRILAEIRREALHDDGRRDRL